MAKNPYLWYNVSGQVRKVGYRMKRYPIAKEYVKELNEHKYVEKATDWTVSFTEEFKQLVYDEYYRGKSISEIFISMPVVINIR